MNREIKFRHWFPNTSVMTAGHHPHTLILTSTGKEDIWKDCVWLQFTGLKDKNGKEIYEGDILSLLHDEYGSPIPSNFKGEVKFYESGFFVDNHKDFGTPVFQEIAQWLIIGNIYQNPELLTEI